MDSVNSFSEGPIQTIHSEQLIYEQLFQRIKSMFLFTEIASSLHVRESVRKSHVDSVNSFNEGSVRPLQKPFFEQLIQRIVCELDYSGCAACLCLQPARTTP